MFALWARRFWIYDSVCTVQICCNHSLTAKKLGIFQWLWWFSFKGLTLSCEEKLFALWARRFWIYDYVCTVPICCNHIHTAKKTWYFPTCCLFFACLLPACCWLAAGWLLAVACLLAACWLLDVCLLAGCLLAACCCLFAGCLLAPCLLLADKFPP